MGRKRTKIGTMKRTHSYKTKKRLEVKRQMLAQRTRKQHG